MSLSRAFATTGRMVAIQLKVTNRRILRAFLNLISAALLLRVGGMVNQVIISASFGTGTAMDAYFVAAALPFLLAQLLGSAVEAAVIPVYSRLRLRSGKEAASRLFCTVLNCLLLAAILLMLTLFLLRQQLVFFSAPGLDPARFGQALVLTQLLYLVLPLSLVLGLLESVLNAEGRFGWPAYAGLLVPLTTAALAWTGGRTWGVVVLCIGNLLGTALQLVVVCVRARQAGLRYQLVIDLRDANLHTILRSLWPVLLGALIVQGGPLVDQIFASTLPAGSISALNYALKLVSLFIGIIFVSVGRAVLPYLASQAALGDPDYRAFKGTLCLYLRGIGFGTLVLSLLLFLLGHPLVQMLFQRGAFSAVDTQNTVTILSGFAVGLMPMGIGFLISRAFNALGEARIPVYIALVSVSANALFDALFAHFWQALGIALATSAVSFTTSLLLLALLYRRIGNIYLWRMPIEVQAFRACFRRTGLGNYSIFLMNWLKTRVASGAFIRKLLLVSSMLSVLAVGIISTIHNALATLRVASGMLIVLCFLRCPYPLLLAWASISVCIGSSLAIFNGNNLDMVLIIPLLLLLTVLPWNALIRWMPGLIWSVLYLGWVLIGMGISPLDPRAFLTFWLTMVASIAVGALAIALVTTRRRLFGLIDTLLTTALLVALYGLYGFATHQRGEVDPVTLLFRITSLFTQATTCAFYLSLIFPLALYRCLYLRGAHRCVGTAVALCLLAALLLTFTRSAYAGVFLSALVMAFCVPNRRIRLALISILSVLCGLAFCLGWSGHLPLLARFFSGDVATLNGRVYLWQALLSNFQITRWLGNGLQSSDQLLTYLRVGSFGQGVIGTAPHNLFLGTLYDHGIIGLLLLVVFFLSLAYRLLRGVRSSCGEQRMLYATALATLVSMLLQSLGSRDLWIQSAGIPFWLVIALPFACYWHLTRTNLDAPGNGYYLSGNCRVEGET